MSPKGVELLNSGVTVFVCDVSIVILLALLRFLCVRHGDGRVAPGVVAAGPDLDPGAIFVIRKLRNIVGQYSSSALLAVFKPIRIP